MKDFESLSIEAHKKTKGKLEICSRFPVTNKEELSIAYSPGVAGPSKAIKEHPELYKELTSAAQTVAVISDGTAVLGLGDIGPKAAMPVMEGKAVLFKSFANINAFPLVINTTNVEEFITTVKRIAPSFGGINLEDISAPRCFEIEQRLKSELDIPVFHDDQHGTAIVTLAGIINYLKLTNKDRSAKIVVNGSGAAGIAISHLIHDYGFTNIIVCDSKGIIASERTDLNEHKRELLVFSNKEQLVGSVFDALVGADIFIGVSKGNLLQKEHIQSMNEQPAIFAMANPDPEIKPELAHEAGALVVGTGRSDYPNQINNVLVFPGIFKGAFLAGVKNITDEMKCAAAKKLASLVDNPSPDHILPPPFQEGIADAIAQAIVDVAKK